MNSIVIIGGGAAGLALATGLSKFSNNDITIIEKTNYDSIFSGEHLQSQILPIFENLNIPKEILLENSTVCEGILGSWANRPILSQGFFNQYGFDYIVHRPEFEKSLADYLKAKGVKFYLDSFPAKIEKREITVGNDSLRYDFLFDCSGRTSQQFKTQRIIFDKLLGISFYDFDSKKSDSKVIIESAENGWWYHTGNKKMSITTYFTDSDFDNLDSANLQAEMNKTKIVKNYCKKLKGKPQRKSAYTSILKTFPTEIFQVGDSYFSLDPLSSQGILKAFRQASVVMKCFASGNFEKAISEFYSEQRGIFFQNLKFREFFYQKGWEFYKSEFYRRRIELGLLNPTSIWKRFGF